MVIAAESVHDEDGRDVPASVNSEEIGELDEQILETLRAELQTIVGDSIRWSDRLDALSELLRPYNFTLIKDNADHSLIRKVMVMARMDFVHGNPLVAYEIVRCLGSFQLDCTLKPFDIPENDLWWEDEPDDPKTKECQEILMRMNPILDDEEGEGARLLDILLPRMSVSRQVEVIVKVLEQMRTATAAATVKEHENNPHLGYALQHVQETNRYSEEEISALFLAKWTPTPDPGFGRLKKRRFLVALAEESLARIETLKQACNREAKDNIRLFDSVEPILGDEVFCSKTPGTPGTEVSGPKLSIRKAKTLLQSEIQAYRNANLSVPKMLDPPYAKVIDVTLQYYERKKALQQLQANITATLREVQEDFKNQQDIPDEQDDGTGATVRQDRLRDKKKRIAVIGYCLKDANISVASDNPTNGQMMHYDAGKCEFGRHECPVLVRKEIINDDVDPDNAQELYEIGACNGGTYVVVHPSNEIALKKNWAEWSLGIAKHDSIDILQYIPPHQSGVIGSKPLEKVLMSGYTHIMLCLPEITDDERRGNVKVLISSASRGTNQIGSLRDDIAGAKQAGSSFLIKLPTATMHVEEPSVQGVHTPFTFIGVDRVSSDAPVGGRSLDRFLVIFSQTNKLANLDFAKNLKQKRYKESVGVIADALSLRIKPSSTVTRLNDKEIASKQMLLFFASSQFLDDFGLFNRVRKYWDNVEKRLENEPQEKREALKLVLDLTIRKQPFDVAVARSRTILHLPRILSDHLRTELHVMPLELSNFQAVCDELERVDKTCAAPQFFLIRIQGKITAQAILSLIQRTSTSVKLIFEYGVEIEIALNENNTAGKKIRDLGSNDVAKGDDDDESSRSQTELFDQRTCIGGLVTASYERFANDPALLREFVSGDVEIISEPGFRQAGWDWLDQVKKWLVEVHEKRANIVTRLRLGRLTDESSELRVADTARLLVTRSGELSVSMLRVIENIEVHDIDASDGTKETENELRKIIEPFVPRSGGEKAPDQQQKIKLIVLRNPAFLRKEALSLIVFRCAERQEPILLLSPSPNQALTVLQLPDQGQRSDYTEFVATLRIIEQHLDLMSLKSVVPTQAFRALHLLFGQALPPADDIKSMIKGLDEDMNSVEEDNFSLEKAPKSLLMHLDGTKGLVGAKCIAIRKQIVVALRTLSLSFIDEDSTPVIPLPTKDDSLAVILVRHAFAAIFSKDRANSADGEKSILLGYTEFSSRTQYSYLSQVHRVEAYLAYLDNNIDTSIVGFDGGLEAHRLSICSQFRDVRNVLHSQLGDILQSIFIGEATHLHSIEQYRPRYERPMGANALTDESTIFENACLDGNPVHTNLMYGTWKTAAGIPSQLLTHLLNWGKNPMALILSLDVHHIANLSMAFASLQHIERDHGSGPSDQSQCHPLVKEYLNGVEMLGFVVTDTKSGVPDATVKRCQDRLSALGWLLMRSRLLKNLDDSNFSKIVGGLVQSDIRFDIDSKSSSDNVDDTDPVLLRVAKALIELDAPVDLLSSRQHVIKDFLMAGTPFRQTSLQQLFSGTTGHLRIGRAFVHLCAVEGFTSEAASLRNIIRILSSWFRGSSNAYPSEAIRISEESILTALAEKLTPAASAGLLLQAPNLLTDSKDELLEHAVDLIVKPCLSKCKQGEFGIACFLDQLIESNSTLAIKVLEVLTAKHPDLFQNPVGPVVRNGFWDQAQRILLLSPIERAAHVREADNFESFLKAAKSADAFSAVAASHLLMESYRQSLSTSEVGAFNRNQLDKDLLMHQQALGQDKSFRESAFRLLNAPTEPLHRRQKWLLWYSWCAFPDSLLIHEPSSVEEWADLKHICDTGNLMKEVLSAKSISFLARFLCVPHTLPVQAYKIKADMARGQGRGIVPEAVRLQQAVKRFAQENHAIFPPYVFRVQQRGLPRESISALISRIQQDRDRVRAPVNWTLDDICPRVTVGVSVETLRENLRLLANLPEAVTRSIKATSHHDYAIAHLAQVLLAWFKAAGFSRDDMDKLAGSLEQADRLKTSLSKISEANGRSKPNWPVFVPLPLFLDVRLVETSFKVSLFGKSASSKLATSQWIDILATCYEFKDVDTRSMHVKMEAEEATESLQYLAESLCESLTSSLVKNILYGAHFRPGAETPPSPWSLDTSAFVDRIVTCVEFLQELSGELMTVFFEAFALSLAGGEEVEGEPSQERKNASCVISDSLFALIGLNPINRGKEVVTICKAFTSQKLPVSSTLIDESRWLINNLFQPDVSRYLEKDVDNFLRAAIPCQFRRTTSTTETGETMGQFIAPYLDSLIRRTQSDPQVVQPFEYDLSLVRANVEKQHASSSVTQPVEVPSKHRANVPGRARIQAPRFDHVEMPASDDTDLFSPLPSILTNTTELVTVSEATSAGPRGGASHLSDALVGQVNMPKEPMNIDARQLVKIEVKKRHAIISVAPGKFSALEKPIDQRTRPTLIHLPMSHLNSRRALPASADSAPSDRIENVFQDNGQAWKYVSSMQHGTVILSGDFVLRRLNDGGLALIVGRPTDRPMYLWHILDTANLVNLDLPADVVSGLSFIVKRSWVMARKTEYSPAIDLLDIKTTLDAIREAEHRAVISAAGEKLEGDDVNIYAKYLEWEEAFCSCLQKCAHEIKESKETRRDLPAFVIRELREKTRTLNRAFSTSDELESDLLEFLTSVYGIFIDSSVTSRTALTSTIDLVVACHESRKIFCRPLAICKTNMSTMTLDWGISMIQRMVMALKARGC